MTKQVLSTKSVEFALRNYHDLSQLLFVKNAFEPLISAHFLTGTTPSQNDSLKVLQTILYAAIDALKPSSINSIGDPEGIEYIILFDYHIQKKHIEMLAQELGYTPRNVFRWRQRGIKKITQFLKKQLESDQLLLYKSALLREKYATYTTDQQQTLQFMSLVRQPIALKTVLTYVSDIASLLTNQTICEEHSLVWLHPDLQGKILAWVSLSPAQYGVWHRQLGLYYLDHLIYDEASHHFVKSIQQHCLARSLESAQIAVELFLEYQEVIVLHQYLAQVQRALDTLSQRQLPTTLYAKLQLSLGNLARRLQDLKTAEKSYKQALQTDDSWVRVKAYCRLGESLILLGNFLEAQIHYERVIDQLSAENPHLTPQTHALLLAESHIGFAWYWIQYDAKKTMLQNAARHLEEAEKIIKNHFGRDANILESQLYNARASLYVVQKRPATEILSMRHHSLFAAERSQQKYHIITSKHNLAYDYAELAHNYEKALTYLQEALQDARQTQNEERESFILKDIGACYFWMEAYSDAIIQYHLAHTLFEKTENLVGVLSIHYNLVESYSENFQWESALEHWRRGMALTVKLGKFGTMFTALKQSYAFLHTQLNSRQRAALNYIRQHDAITRKIYCDLDDNKIASTTARQELNELCERELLFRVGQGRATRYQSSPKQIPQQ